MIWQYLFVGVIVFSALVLTAIRCIGFFKAPASKCGSCSGCKLAELKKDISKQYVVHDS